MATRKQRHWLFGRGSQVKSQRRPALARRLGFEPLEGRRLLTATLETLHDFGTPDGTSPMAGLTLDPTISTLYGTSSGTIFSEKTDGTGYQTLHSFGVIPNDGTEPEASLTLVGSTLYGTTHSGGTDEFFGTIFSMNTDGTAYRVLHNFTNTTDQYPDAHLTVVGNTIFGTTDSGGTAGGGTLFSMNTDGTDYTVIDNFASGGSKDGSDINSGLTLSGSLLYGASNGGGANGRGMIYSVHIDGSGFQPIYSFAAAGARPDTDLTIVGSTIYGSADGDNSILYSVSTSGSNFDPLHTFSAQVDPSALTVSGSMLYGTTQYDAPGENEPMVLFSFNTNGSVFTPLRTYASSNVEGDQPAGGLLLVGSTLYATTSQGEIPGAFDGTVYSIQTNGGNVQVLHDFGTDNDGGEGADGEPEADLTVGGPTLYGTTPSGGTVYLSGSYGTIYSMKADGTDYQILHAFSSALTDGEEPLATLTLVGSTLYGTTEDGGQYGESFQGGTVFAINTDGSNFHLLHSFAYSDGNYPIGGLVYDSANSTLYGTTSGGGTHSDGTIFSISTDGSTFHTVYNFSEDSDGSAPEAALTLSGSTLYGTTATNGAGGAGTVFAVGIDGSNFHVLHPFTDSSTDGGRPLGGLTLVGSTLYGTTQEGGPNGGVYGDGTVFEIDTNGSNYNILNFFSGTNGGAPMAGLTLNGSILYGTTEGGGSSNYGTMFSINTSNNSFQTVYSLTSSAMGTYPDAGLAIVGGAVYGTTSFGGYYHDGNVFSLSLLNTPNVTAATTTENTQTNLGLVITPNAADAGNVNGFQITAITGGLLYQHDGVTPITNGGYITLAQAAAGLKFTPWANSTLAGSFIVQGSYTAGALGLGGPTATASITVNRIAAPDPGFEGVSVAAGGWQYAPTDPPWTFTGTAGISENYSAVTGGNPAAPQGNQVGFIQDNGSLSETLTLAVGTYTVDFLAAQRGNYSHGGQSLQVSVDGTAVGSGIAPIGANYALYATATFNVTTAGSHTITLTGLDPHGGDNTALLDDVSVQTVTANQIADPDFSAVSVGAGNWQYTPSGSTWTFVGSAGVSGNGSAISAGNPSAPQGTQVAFVQGSSSISEAVNLSAGNYTLSFSAAQRGNYNQGGQALQVLVDGTAVGSAMTPIGSNYATHTTASFTVAAGTHTITIAGTNPNGGDNTALVDNVSIQPAVTVTATQLADPDFGAVSVGAGNWEYTPSGSPWTFTGTAGVSGNGGAIAGGNPNAPQGTQVAFVQMTGSISQQVNLAAGSYTLDFSAAQRGNYNQGGQTVQVSVDGTAVGSVTPTGSSYALFTVAFSATAGTHTITLAGTNPHGGDNTALIDNVSVQPAVTATQLADPDFAAVSVGAGNWEYAPSGSPWTFTGTAGVSGNGGAIAGGNPNAPQGTQVAFVQMTGSISQQVNLAAGSYTLDFSAAQRGNYNQGGQTVQVSIDGTPVGSVTPTGSSYALFTVAFTATAGTHTITLAGTNPHGGDNTALIDNVSVQPAVTATQLADPDFGAVSVGAGNWEYTPSGSPWTFTGTAGISGNGGAIAGGNASAPQGSQVGFVQMTGSISQAVNLSAGTYTVEFVAAQRGNYNQGGQTLQVLVDGTAVGSITPSGASYVLYATPTFTATAGTHTITIAGTNPHGGDNTALLDDVSVQAITANQTADPDFGAVTIGAGNWQYSPSGSAWTFVGSAGVSGNGSAITSGNANAPQGSQVGFVQGTGSISQAVSLSAGSYTISFSAAQRGNYNQGGQTLQVLVDGANVGSGITPASATYNGLTSISFTVSTGMHDITIQGLNPQGGDNTALIDAVMLNMAS